MDRTFTLTEALLIAGGAVLLTLLVHGWWVARKASPRRPEPSAGPRAEPQLDEQGHPLPQASKLDSVMDVLSAGDSAFTATHHADTLPMVVHKARPARRPSLRLDALIDVIATLHLEAPTTGEAALAHLPPTRRAGSKPFAIEGLNTESGEWELPQAGERYGEFQAGLQLANRSGPLTEIEFSEWVHKVQAFADGVGAMADFPDMREAVSRARELDQFASQHDAQLSVVLRAKGAAWTLGFLTQAAAKLGLVHGGLPGRLVLPAAEDGEPPLLALQFDPRAALAEEGELQALRAVTLVFDVPQTPEAMEPFAALQDLARRLSRELEAEVVDGDGQPLGPHGFAAIHEDLGRLYRQLASCDLTAGSAAARRLFS
jgi:hypothetical protein